MGRLTWGVLALLISAAAIAAGGGDPAPVDIGGDGGVSLPLGEIPLPVALVWATWMLSRWKPRLHLVIEQTGPPKESD